MGDSSLGIDGSVVACNSALRFSRVKSIIPTSVGADKGCFVDIFSPKAMVKELQRSNNLSYIFSNRIIYLWEWFSRITTINSKPFTNDCFYTREVFVFQQFICVC